MSKQTAVRLILDKFNLLSDNDFKSWILNHYDELIQMEREQIIDAYNSARNDHHQMYFADEYFNKTYGGQNE